MPKTSFVEIAKWGKDHWSMLAYLETCAVDAKGVVDPLRVRCNPKRHPGLAVSRHSIRSWMPEWGTKLKGGTVLPNHDDWDVFEDLEAAGFVRWMGTGIHPVAVLTDAGRDVTGRLRAHKAAGGMFGNFSFEGAIPA